MIRHTSPRYSHDLQKICASWNPRLRALRGTNQRRHITENFVKKTLEAKLQWARQATKIKAGEKESMLTMLEKRGYINQIVGKRDDLDRLLTEKRVGIYVGVDPTAPSMHVGHLLPLMVLYWMYMHGFHACSLLGGATAQIGDPIGRTTARESQHSDVRKINMFKIHMQLKMQWSHVEVIARRYSYEWEWAWKRELTNNNAWLNKFPMLQFLKLLGSGVRLGPMLGRDTVKDRMKSKEGMSFSEFTYPLLQSWDWWHMYSTKDIQVQVGGSDQFGNILAGVDAINYIRHNHYDPEIRQDEEKLTEREAFHNRPMGFTVPLLTTSSGAKFGKSEGNAIWLDSEMTSTFDLYQFFVRTPDSDVHRYLKLFTFEPLEVLETIMEEHEKDPAKRIAQHKLAQEVLNLVHGETLAKIAEQEHRRLFQKGHVPSSPTEDDGNESADSARTAVPSPGRADLPTNSLVLPKSLVYNQRMSNVLYHAGLAPSRVEGHRMVMQKGVYLGARPAGVGTMSEQVDYSRAANWEGKETAKYMIGDQLIVRVGKWNIKVIKVISDEEFEARGFSAPGWKDDVPEKPLTKDLLRMKPWHKKSYIKNAAIHQKDPVN